MLFTVICITLIIMFFYNTYNRFGLAIMELNPIPTEVSNSTFHCLQWNQNFTTNFRLILASAASFASGLKGRRRGSMKHGLDL